VDVRYPFGFEELSIAPWIWDDVYRLIPFLFLYFW
jgi:hypothetical protein